MNRQILTDSQEKLLTLIKSFSPDFYLAGGTAIALHIGHRRSIDFDLFTDTEFDPMTIRKKIIRAKAIEQTIVQGVGELTIVIDQVKITFFHYPYKIQRDVLFEQTIRLPNIATLGAMKAFALGKRAKWKDYVDLYFILQKYSFSKLVDQASDIFTTEFNEKLFRVQLGYFKDIDYSEEVEYLAGREKENEEIKRFLERVSIE